MKVIYKYEVKEKFHLELPVDAQVLTVQSQHNTPQMWILLDPEAPKITRTFYTFATGERFDNVGLSYRGTFQLSNGSLISHVFELTE